MEKIGRLRRARNRKREQRQAKKLTAFAIVVTYILGDADGDGVITAVDATLVLRYLVKLSVPNVEIVERNGDIDGEGLDITDVSLILRHVIEADVPYPVGSLVEQIL